MANLFLKEASRFPTQNSVNGLRQV